MDASGSDLLIRIDGTTDQILVSSFFSSINYRLEILKFADGSSYNISQGLTVGGSAGNDIIIGTPFVDSLSGAGGNDYIYGSVGVDTITGGAGNDTYIVDTQSDSVIEYVAEGTDTVQSSVSYTLGQNLENLTLTGSSAINATGNDLANTLAGNTGDNILDGAAGADTMIGGAGDDIYLVDNASDVVTENANEGVDTVYASVNHSLGSNLENLVLVNGAISGTGNALDNMLSGNSAANTLNGGAGNDMLDGGTGADILIGGTGNDTYVFGRGYGADTVQENDITAGNTDVAQFTGGIAYDQLWLRHVGNNLEFSIIGTADTLTIQNWYNGGNYQVEQFKTADGKTLPSSDAEQLVQAMAGYAPPSSGTMVLPPAYQTALAPTLAANWR